MLRRLHHTLLLLLSILLRLLLLLLRWRWALMVLLWRRWLLLLLSLTCGFLGCRLGLLQLHFTLSLGPHRGFCCFLRGLLG